MFKSLFGRKESPTKNGKSAKSASVGQLKWKKVFWIELSNMEGMPKYKLTHQLSIGSEVGNVIISDPSISPRHCSFILQDEVISLLDHGSVSGTFVNEKKIAAGKYILLEDSDTVRLGELEVKIETSSEVIEEIEETMEEIQEDLPELPESNAEEYIEEEVEILEEESEEEEPQHNKSLIHKFKTRFIRKNNDIAFSTVDKNAANTLVRVFAVIIDILLSITLSIVLGPYDDFKTLINETIPGLIRELNLGEIVAVFLEDYPVVIEIFNDVLNFTKEYLDLSVLFITFFLLRFVSTFIFGASIGEVLVGIKGSGNIVWKRIGGALRVILGMFTAPFVIFDIPALISRRTFKEFMTFTHLIAPSKILSFLGVIIFIPLSVILLLVSPMFQGFEIPEKINVETFVDKRKKVAEEGAQEIELLSSTSSTLGIAVGIDESKNDLLPTLEYIERKKKLSVSPGLLIFDKDLNKSAKIKLDKNFSLKELTHIALSHNPFLMEKYPNLYQFAYSIDKQEKNFKPKNLKVLSKGFSEEFIQLVKLSFELDLDNFINVMTEVSPVVSGLVNFKASLMELIQDKSFDSVDFVEIGNATFLRFSYLKQSPYDLLIPLIPSAGHVYRVDFKELSEIKPFKNQLYKFILNNTNWFFDGSESGASGAFIVFDFYSSYDALNLDEGKAQSAYGYYFETSSRLLKEGNSEINKNWLETLNSSVLLFEKSSKINEGQNPVVEKMYQNLRDIRDAFENSNTTFFGIETTVTL